MEGNIIDMINDTPDYHMRSIIQTELYTIVEIIVV